MWAVLVCEFGLFNQIQRCKKLQSPSQNVGSFGFVNFDYFENFKQHADSLKFC